MSKLSHIDERVHGLTVLATCPVCAELGNERVVASIDWRVGGWSCVPERDAAQTPGGKAP